MPHYLVFTGRKWRNAVGAQGITWEPAGVWEADDAQNACLIAAQKQGVGTCIAIEGFAWGVDLVPADNVTEIGTKLDPVERLERMGARLAAQIAKSLPPAKQRELNAGDDNGD